jgi:hypothetical protein
MNINLNLEQFESMLILQEQILEQQKRLLEYLPVPDFVDTLYISKRLNISRTKLYQCPWLLPDYGKCQNLNKKKRQWKFSHWQKWNERSELERREEWLSLPVSAKEELMHVS